MENLQKEIATNNEELALATTTLAEVKSMLKGSSDGTNANARAQSAEPAVADVTAGVCKELAQILSTLQLSLEVTETHSQAVKEREKGKDRSRSTSRGRSDKGPPVAGKDANVLGMKAAIARICVLGQQLETLQANTSPPQGHVTTGKSESIQSAVDTPVSQGNTSQASKGSNGKGKPPGADEHSMEVEPQEPPLGDTPNHSAQLPGA
eukprot:6459865-Amphidinium_carterae.3